MKLIVRIGLLVVATMLATKVAALSAPTGTTAPEDSVSGSYEISWNGVSGATSYAIFESVDFGGYSLVQFSGATSYSAIAQDEGTYIYVVAACNHTSCSGFTAPEFVDVEGPQGATSSNGGSFVLQWNREQDANLYPVYQSYNFGPYSLVQQGSSRTFVSFEKPNGTYLYTIGVCDASSCAPSTSPIHQVTVTGSSSSQPDPLREQLLDVFRARTGDFNGDGLEDVLIERTTPSLFVDGSSQTTILQQTSNGGLQPVVPSAGQLNNAMSYPINDNILIGNKDYNIDAFADQMITGLSAAIGVAEDNYLMFAPARQGVSAPLGLTEFGTSQAQFLFDMAAGFEIPNYFEDNLSTEERTLVVPVFGCDFSSNTEGISFVFPNCSFGLFFVNFTAPVGDSFLISAGAHFHLENAISVDSEQTFDSQSILQFSLLYRSIFGVDIAGVGVNDGNPPTDEQISDSPSPNDSVPPDDVVDNRIARSWQNLLIIILESLRNEPTGFPPGPGGPVDIFEPGPHSYMTDTLICNPSPGDSLCTIENVFCWAKVLNAPRDGGVFNQPIENGGPSILDGRNPIITHTEGPGVPPNTIINETRPTHIFHPDGQADGCALTGTLPCAIVERQVKEDSNGGIRIMNMGTGNARFPMSNELGGQILFEGLDQQIRDLINGRILPGEGMVFIPPAGQCPVEFPGN